MARRKFLINTIASWATLAVLGTALIVGNYYANKYQAIISVYLNQPTSKVVKKGDSNTNTQYYASDYSSEDAQLKASEDLGRAIVAEGSVLLKNEGNTLPLAEGERRVSLFGTTSVNLVYGGGGAGSIDTSKVKDLKTALEEENFKVNDTLWNFYSTGPGKDYRNTVSDAYGRGEFKVNEVPVDKYDAATKNSFSSFSDAAIVMMGRAGGESGDLPDGYLNLTQEEKDLLKMVKDSGVFKKIIVVMNTSNPTSIKEFDDPQYGVNSILWIGSVGQNGIEALGHLLDGTYNPSGKLVDTYAYDWKSAPASVNFGNFTYSNVTSTMNDPNGISMASNTYVNYVEGIYVGYRYYETRYADKVMNSANVGDYNYTDTVHYPFGYGLSYTNFTYSNYSVKEQEKTFEVSIDVTNNGNYAGKDVVEVYAQTPYTSYDKENGIEKSAIQLVGFKKTGLLEKGAKETVTVSVEKKNLASYDYKNAKTYIMDAGNYYLSIGDNAHDALNNIFAYQGYTTSDGMDKDGDRSFTYKFSQDQLDKTTYSISDQTNKEITNHLDDVDMNFYKETKYLSRSNWTGTYPVPYVDSGNSMEAPKSIQDGLLRQYKDDPEAKMPKTSIIDPNFGQLQLVQFMGLKYDDPMWDSLLNQMTPEEMYELVRIGGYSTKAVESVGKMSTVDKDGPAGITGTLVGGGNGFGYPSEITLASSWNVDLALEMGKLVGEDGLKPSVKTTGWYAPAMNIHRTAYSGRNFEYYSEDPYLSGKFGAATVEGAQKKGLVTYIKHFALNDQETNRMGGNVFSNEQAAREIYLKPFQITVEEGDAHGVMVSMNRLGPTWSGAHKGLMTNILRDEWGFEGVALTDQASYSVFEYMEFKAGLTNGLDMLLNTDDSLWKIDNYQSNPTIMSNLRRASKNILFAYSRSNSMNGLDSDSRIVKIMPTWQKWLVAADVIIPVAILGWAIPVTYFFVKDIIDQKKKAK